MNLRTRGNAAPTQEQLARMRQEAWSHSTPPDRLAQLVGQIRWGAKVDRRVIEGVARNPSSPPEALGQVLPLAPDSFCRNRAVPLIALASPEFCGSLPLEGLALVLRSPQASPLLVSQMRGLTGYWLRTIADDAAFHISQRPEVPAAEWAVEIRRYWEGALQQVREPEEMDDLYGFSPGDSIRELAELELIPEALVQNCPLDDPLPGYTYDGFRSRAEPKEARAMDQARKKPLHGPLKEYPEETALYRYLGAAFSEQAAEADVVQWADKLPWLALAAAQRPTLSPAVWKRFVGHVHPGVRRIMLRRPDLPADLRAHARTGVLKRAVRGFLDRSTGPEFMLARFVAQLYAPDPVRRPFWRSYVYSYQWQDRLSAAVAIRDRPNGQPMRARHALLLERLAQDGNVLVRAAARARLRGETFSW